MTTGNPCPVKGCTAQAKPRQLMCWPHWRRVPKALNRAVFDTFRNVRAEPRAYRKARDAAIASVEAKEAEEGKTLTGFHHGLSPADAAKLAEFINLED